MFTLSPSKKYLISFYSLNDIKKYPKEVISSIMSTSGTFSALTKIPEENIDNFISVARKFGAKDIEIELSLILNNVPYINVLKEVYDQLDEVSQLAIILHEEGHIHHNHINSDAITNNGLIINVNIKNEIEADNYAAKFVGKHNVRKAIKLIIRKLALLVVNNSKSNTDKEQLFNKIYSMYTDNEIFKARLANLS